MDHSLTVVLPMYNCEREVRSSVLNVLEISQSDGASIEVIVVDDGSTDETYETACELARVYPQLTVLRRSVRQGLGSALDLVRHRISAETVVVHDGVSPVKASQLKSLLERRKASGGVLQESIVRDPASGDCVGSRRFSAVRSLHDSLEETHRAITGFNWMRLAKPVVPRRTAAYAAPVLDGAAVPLVPL